MLADLKDDWGQPDSLFPMTKFDAVIITAKPSLGRTVTLTNKQISDLLEIINDPVSFWWGETTPDKHYYVIFMYEGEVVRKLSICSCNSCLNPEPNWPEFKKMKFGSLRRDKIVQLGRLLRDIGF